MLYTNCLAEVSLPAEEGDLLPLEESRSYREVSLNESVLLLSFYATVTVEEPRVSKRQASSQLQNDLCLLLLYGDNAESVLVSNVVR